MGINDILGCATALFDAEFPQIPDMGQIEESIVRLPRCDLLFHKISVCYLGGVHFSKAASAASNTLNQGNPVYFDNN